jgi:hypothetical protein
MAKQQTKGVSKTQSASAESPAARPVVAQIRPDSSTIAALAYRLWQERGCPEGSPEIDWFLAEQELCQSVKSKSPSTKRLLLTRQVGA